MKKKIISICYYGRSGSVFLQSLFDGHPECITIPGPYMTGFYYWYKKKIKSSKNIINSFLEDFNFIFDPEFISKDYIPFARYSPGIDNNFHKLGINNDQKLIINKALFKKNLCNLISDKNVRVDIFFLKIHEAYAKTIGLDWKKIKYIIFQLHDVHTNSISFLNNEFECILLRVIRNPIKSNLSLVHHKIEYIKRDIPNLLSFLLDEMNTFDTGLNKFSKEIYIKLEDLHNHPRSLLKKILNNLNLEWDDVILKSTFNNIQFNNLNGAIKVSGFNQKVISKKFPEYITEFDEKRLIKVFEILFLKWQYTNHKQKIHFFHYLKKFKLENNISFFQIVENRIKMLKIFTKTIIFKNRIPSIIELNSK